MESTDHPSPGEHSPRGHKIENPDPYGNRIDLGKDDRTPKTEPPSEEKVDEEKDDDKE